MKLKSSTKFTIVIISILLFIVFFLTITNKHKIKVIEKSTHICDLASFYKGSENGMITYCLNNKASVSVNNEEDVEIDIDNIIDFYYYYNVLDDTSYFYLINIDGEVFESNSNKLFEKNFKFEKLDVKNIVKIKTLTDNKTNKFSIYAINGENDLFLLKTLY